MKQKIIKILERPKTVIPVTLIVFLIIGFILYKNIGITPNIKLDNLNNIDSSISNTLSEEYKDGEVINLAFPKSGRVNEVYVKTGESVKKGKVLASLDSTDAKGALDIAKANYEKIINGATGVAVDVAKAAVHTAEVSLEGVTKQQDVLVKNAYKNLLNSTPEAVPDGSVFDYTPPIISGNYSKGLEGKINLSLYYTNNGANFSVSGIINGYGTVNAITPQPLGDSGLYIKIPSNTSMNVSNWIIEIPNKKATNYIANNNAYQAALETQNQTLKNAQATLDQANASLSALVAAARPEDVASAFGALQIAQGAYNNNFIYATSDGIVSVVNINPGEIVTMNQKAISIIAKVK